MSSPQIKISPLASGCRSTRLSITLPTIPRDGIIGESAAILAVFSLIEKLGPASCTVLILGETGTGKELVARSLHARGPSKDGPFVPVDCGAISPSLIESEFFGYVKGAFTGAFRTTKGVLETANGGTIFLDEIANLELQSQSRLLRAIEAREIRPLGATRYVPLNFRIIAASNSNLTEAVAQGSFREDLFYRLNVAQLNIPPLRERRSDIPLIIEHLIGKFAITGESPRIVSNHCMRILMDYDWPGNVRELQNAIEGAIALCNTAIIEVDDLPDRIRPLCSVVLPSSNENLSIASLKRRAILRSVEMTGGDIGAASRLLDIPKTTLYRKLKAYRPKS